MATQEHVQQEEVDGLKKLHDKAQSTLKSMEEQVAQLIGDDVAAFFHHFEEERRWVGLLYPRLDLTPWTLLRWF